MPSFTFHLFRSFTSFGEALQVSATLSLLKRCLVSLITGPPRVLGFTYFGSLASCKFGSSQAAGFTSFGLLESAPVEVTPELLKAHGEGESEAETHWSRRSRPAGRQGREVGEGGRG